MDLSNFIDNNSDNKMSSELNTSDFNFNEISPDIPEGLVNGVTNEVNDEFEKTKQNVLRDLFTSLADGYNACETINMLIKKYGTNIINDKIRRLVKKFEHIIGNYIITCRYNDNKGKKNPAFIKYCLYCDCKDNEVITKDKEFDKCGIDGFFTDNGKDKINKIRICKKHGLQVLSSIDDLSEDEFNELAKKVSEVKQIDKKDVINKTSDKSIFGKIRQIFCNIKPKKIVAKIDTESYNMKDANVKASVTISDEFKSASVSDVQKPLLDKVNIAKKENIEESKVNIPNNKIDVKLGKGIKQMDNFTISKTKVKNIDLINENKSINFKMGGKNINVCVEKEIPFLENISIYTKPLNDFDMNEDIKLELDSNEDNFDENSIETDNDFNF